MGETLVSARTKDALVIDEADAIQWLWQHEATVRFEGNEVYIEAFAYDPRDPGIGEGTAEFYGVDFVTIVREVHVEHRKLTRKLARRKRAS